MVNHNKFLGYTKNDNGELIIVPEEAEIVQRIFKEFLAGQSPYKIAAGLERDGKLTGSGGSQWYDSTVIGILKNEKYQGDALLQKTYTVDFLSKKRVEELRDYLMEQESGIDKFDEVLFRRFVKKVMIQSMAEVSFVYKVGVEVREVF